IEALIGRKVFLQLWVKVKAGWSDSEASLRSLGYDAD
ncbi:MAG TPA: GTPase Era, partial [Gammaproteobacteria bacterium]